MESPERAQIKKYLENHHQDLAKIHAAHTQSLATNEDEIIQWKKFIKDYNVLQAKLTTYPDKTSYDEIIPIGSLAFMKGRKIHTNEILVHLGENWFAERSVKDAISIIARRREVCVEKLKSAERISEIHKGWIREAEQLSKETNQFDIVEQISEEEYQRDKEKHKEMVSRHISISSKNTEEKSDPMEEMRNFEDLLKKLDMLEEEEQLEDQLIIGSSEGDDSDNNMSKRSESESKLLRRVSWADNLSMSVGDESPDEVPCLMQSEVAGNSNSELTEQSEETARIKYSTKFDTSVRQSKVSYDDQHVVASTSDDSTNAIPPQSPSDLFHVISNASAAPAKSILKKKCGNSSIDAAELDKSVLWAEKNDTLTFVPNTPDEDEETPHFKTALSESPREIKKLKPAFSYKIVPREDCEETSSETSPTTSKDLTTNTPENAATTFNTPENATTEPKKISKFKASRMNK